MCLLRTQLQIDQLATVTRTKKARVTLSLCTGDRSLTSLEIKALGVGSAHSFNKR